MKTIYLIKTDFRNIFRDPSMIMVFVVPFLMLILLRVLPPLYEPYLPVAFEYRPLIVAFFGLLTSSLTSFLMAFVMLDEKDQYLFQVFRVTPFTFTRLIRLRILSMLFTGFILNVILISGSGLISFSLVQVLLFSFLCSLSGPASALFIVTISANKIEGATYFKLLNMVVIAALAGMFIPGSLKYLFGFIPYFWVFISSVNVADERLFYLFTTAGIVIHLIYLGVAYLMFIRKNG